jgi:hypothetical protein
MICMSLRLSLAAAAALLGATAFAAPSFAVMQVIHLPDPNAPVQSEGPPDGLFDRSVPDTWQKKSTDGAEQKPGSFHFTMSGSAGDFSPTQAPSAYDAAKRPLSEFYQPMPGYQGYPGYPGYQDPLFPH